MKNKTTLATVLGTLTLTVAGLTWAMGPGGDCNPDKMRRHGDFMMGELLNLSDEQRTEIKSIRESYGFDKKQMRKGHKGTMKGFMALNPTAADYDAQVDALIEKRTAKMAERMKKHAKMHAEVYAVLTPEQQEKFVSFKGKMKERMSDDLGE